MEWDVGAGYLIAKEAGAEIKGLMFNKEYLFNDSFSVKFFNIGESVNFGKLARKFA